MGERLYIQKKHVIEYDENFCAGGDNFDDLFRLIDFYCEMDILHVSTWNGGEINAYGLSDFEIPQEDLEDLRDHLVDGCDYPDDVNMEKQEFLSILDCWIDNAKNTSGYARFNTY